MGFLAAGYRGVENLAEQIAQARCGCKVFGVNLFVPGPPADLAAARAYQARLLPWAQRLGVELPEPVQDDDAWDVKIALLLEDPVPVVSFTFGLPDADVVARLHGVGTACWGTVTSAAEARAAAQVGVDALVVQGPDAGGHRAVYDPLAVPPDQPLADLATDVRAATDLPIAVAGGIATPEAASVWLEQGVTVCAGTAFLDTPEAGSHPVYRAALHDPSFDRTALTRAFSGRVARGLVNRFMTEMGDAAPAAYPAVNQLTAPIRGAAWRSGDVQAVSLWAGTGWRHVRQAPAGEVLTWLAGA